MNRLATIKPDNRGALRIVLDHLAERCDGREEIYTEEVSIENGGKLNHFERTERTEYGTALDMLADTGYGPTVLARALSDIARDDNLPITHVDESAIRKYRDRKGIK